MINDLMPLKEFCIACVWHGNLKVELSEDDWQKLEEIRLCLEPSYQAMKKLQYRNIALTDTYKIWDMCHMKTAKIGKKFLSMIQNYNLNFEYIFERIKNFHQY